MSNREQELEFINSDEMYRQHLIFQIYNSDFNEYEDSELDEMEISELQEVRDRYEQQEIEDYFNDLEEE